ncbi:MAG TPA: hypothetical protein VMA35_00365 [Candidatus Sulfopaludibacter sp.]|nr:hypothetical protein [Candidatus Sulfopaludibacter sp.]
MEGPERRDCLYTNLYYRPPLRWLNRRSLKMLEHLFHCYLAHPREIGVGARRRVPKTGLHRAVCDYLTGMTDCYVVLEYERAFRKSPET